MRGKDGEDMRKEVVMPRVGMQIMTATVEKWHKNVGDMVEEREPLLIISSSMGKVELCSLLSGRLTEVVVGESEETEVGSVIAWIE